MCQTDLSFTLEFNNLILEFSTFQDKRKIAQTKYSAATPAGQGVKLSREQYVQTVFVKAVHEKAASVCSVKACSCSWRSYIRDWKFALGYYECLLPLHGGNMN